MPQSNWKRLVHLSADGAARAPAVAGAIVLYSWAGHLNLTASLHPDVLMGTGEFNAGGNPVMD